MRPERDEAPAWEPGRSTRSAGQAIQGHDTTAQREVEVRVHSAAVVLNALDDGRWDATTEVLDGVGAVLAAASRWAMVAELGIAA